MAKDARVTAAQARRLFLHAQGLLDDPERRATPSALYRLVETMGFVQIDSIPVVERAHHLILAARLDGYRPPMLGRLLERDRRLFEHWTHDAAAIPTAWFPMWRPRFARARSAILANAWWRERLGPEPERVADSVRRRIAAEGPVAARDFEADGARGAGPWWGWKPQKAALEYLWHTGELAIARRVHFQKVYDLTERVLPEASRMPAPSPAEHRDWACRSALARLGVATPGEIAAFWRAVTPEHAAAWCREARARGEVVPVLLEGEDGTRPAGAWAPADWERRLQRLPEAPARLRLLAPFDPILHDRRRARRLFGFDYTFEAFVPAAKRRYGYYTMPLMEGDRLVGRCDPKFERDAGALVVERVWWERGAGATPARRRLLRAACERLAAAIGAGRVELCARK